MTSGGNNFNYFPENQLTKNSMERNSGPPTPGGPLDFVYPAYPIATPVWRGHWTLSSLVVYMRQILSLPTSKYWVTKKQYAHRSWVWEASKLLDRVQHRFTRMVYLNWRSCHMEVTVTSRIVDSWREKKHRA